MDSQRVLVEDLTGKFLVTEDAARELVPLFEGIEIGDELSDALWSVRTPGRSVEVAVHELEHLHILLGQRIQALKSKVTKLQQR